MELCISVGILSPSEYWQGRVLAGYFLGARVLSQFVLQKQRAAAASAGSGGGASAACAGLRALARRAGCAMADRIRDMSRTA